MRRSLSILAGLGLLAAVAVVPVSAGLGPPHTAFFVDGNPTPYRTIGTPTDLSHTGAPANTYDNLYMLGAGLLDVAAAAPGDRDYNGGRWMRFPVTWNVEPVQLTSEAQVLDYASLGLLEIAPEPDALFVCPVIKG
jgi:hypothetical protein